MLDAEITVAIESTANLQGVCDACRCVAEALGFDHFLYAFRAPASFVEPYQAILYGYPPAWRQRYDEQKYLGVDPVLSTAHRSVVPFAWDELDRSDPRVAQLFGEARGFGLCHGFSVPVHGAPGEGGVLSLARVAALPAGAEERQQLFMRAQWFTAIVFQRLRKLVATESKRLTPRERDCLQLAALGHSAYAIGRSMSITERTAVFHLNHAEEKLGARRRQEAIARAVAFGQIGPGCYPARFNESQILLEPGPAARGLSHLTATKPRRAVIS